MKATADARALAQAVGRVAPFTARWAGNEALTAIHVEAADGALRLTATDLEHSATTTCPAEVHDPGVILAPAGVLAKSLAVMDGPVELVHDGDGLALAAGAKSFTMRTGDAAAFPALTWPTAGTPLGEAWADIAAVAVAASDDQSRPGICVVGFSGGYVYATDSYRIHWATVDAALDALVPANAIAKAIRVLGGEVSMGTGERSAVFTDGTTTIAAQLYAGEAVKWRNLIPASTSYRLTAAADDLLDAVAAACAMPADDSNSLRFTFDGDTLLASRTTQDVGSAAASFSAEGTWPEPLVGLDPQYLTDAVKAAGGDLVAIEANSPLKPVVIPGERVSALIMPVRIP